MKKYFLLAVAAGAVFMGTLSLAAQSPAPVFQMRLVDDQPSAVTETMTWISQNQQHSYTNTAYVQKQVLLDQSDIKSVALAEDARNMPRISVKFTEAGARKFSTVTRENIHRQLAIIVNGKICEVPVIQTEISGGEAEITGAFTKNEAKAMVKAINEALGR